MKSKIFDKTKKLLIIILFAFFFALSSFKAADKIVPYSPNCNSSDALYKITYKLKNVDGNRRIGCTGLITINDTTHGYCIEPGVKMGSGYTVTGKEFSKYSEAFFNDTSKSAAKRDMVSQVLKHAINLTSKGVKNATTAEIYKAYAAQVLIWEVISGERTSFDVNDTSTSSNDFYSVINSSAYSSNSAITAIRNEYNAILSKIRATYNSKQLGDSNGVFNQLKASEKVEAMTCDEKSCFLQIKDSDFKYWTIKSKDGLTVSKNATGDVISIMTTEPISKDDYKTIEIEVSGNKGLAYAYTDSSKQDVVTIGGLNRSAYLNVYTPKYQLKIIKTSSSNKITELNMIPLKGAKFKVCTDYNCSNEIETITTNSNGVATYDGLDMPGTYYVKEIETPNGYKDRTATNIIHVSKDDIAGSENFGTIAIVNYPKELNLIKYTKDKETGKSTILNDGCGTNTYIGPEFEIQENGKSLYFKEVSSGNYILASKDQEGATTKLKTCQGRFNVYALSNCKYTIAETKAPEGLVLPSNPTKNVDICKEKGEVTFTNGFVGLEFQKKDEDGNLISGGKFSLQMKVNNVYKDILLKEKTRGYYDYVADLKDTDEGATYIIYTTNDDETNDYGRAFIEKLPPGEYRIVEREAPEGYELIEDKDSTAKITIKDSDKDGYYLVELINQKTNMHGSEDSAELIVTITTGRKVPNYAIIISVLAVLLVVAIILRKKIKK